jgi:putative oxidoreductase
MPDRTTYFKSVRFQRPSIFRQANLISSMGYTCLISQKRCPYSYTVAHTAEPSMKTWLTNCFSGDTRTLRLYLFMFSVRNKFKPSFTQRDMRLTVKRFKNRNTVILPLRFYIGALFVYASIHKIQEPANFAEMIAGFEVLPYWSINVVAVFLPWVELWGGVYLLLGMFVRSSALVLGMLLVAFSVATLLNVLRGSNINCGCFLENANHPITGWSVARDVVWLVMTTTIVVLERRMFSFRKLVGKSISL